jgi:hypothetical protein
MVSNEINDLFNSQMSYGGPKQDYPNIPSAYITIVKLKRALSELSDLDIEEIIESEKSNVEIKKIRIQLVRKIEKMQTWQLFQALNIFLGEGRIEVITYVYKCKVNDKEPN